MTFLSFANTFNTYLSSIFSETVVELRQLLNQLSRKIPISKSSPNVHVVYLIKKR